ncbi:MAG TPA: aldo/keto reductase, partial [Phycisphaerae bacterium]|nr:aldo/keto reductase [Phycisphaerae bacterium]
MHYRTFGQMGFDVSALGFGLMRLPLLDEQSKQVDEDRAVAMIRRAIELGVNYLDTAWVYHDGASERALGKALTGELRAKVRIATKLPTWEIKSRDDLDRYLDAQLERLGTNIDVYLVHCLSGAFWDSLRRLGLLEWAERAMARGRFGRFG